MRDEERPCACIEKGAHRFLQLSIPRLGRARSRSLVQLGDPIAPRAEQESPAHRRSRRHSAMVRYQDCQRPHRGHQQPRSGREGQSSWLSLTAQSHRDHLLDRGQNRPQVGHLRQRFPVWRSPCSGLNLSVARISEMARELVPLLRHSGVHACYREISSG
jgi:hypothetical protein